MEDITEKKIVDFIRSSLVSSENILINMTQSNNRFKYPSRFAFLSIKMKVDKFIEGRRDDRWILMPGLRGTGKTTILAQIYFYLKSKNIHNPQILYLKTDDIVGLLDSNLYEALNAFEFLIKKKLEQIDKPIYILIDEAHFDSNWAQTLKSIYDRATNVFILTTGSSAIAFRKNADVARRTSLVRVYPLRFLEYELLKNNVFPCKGLNKKISEAIYLSKSAQDVFQKITVLLPDIQKYLERASKNNDIQKYLENGSLPYLYNLKPEDAYERALGTLETVIQKDIAILTNFDKKILQSFMKLLLILALSDEITLRDLSKNLGISLPKIQEMLEALEQSEIIDSIPSHGRASAQINKPPKYVFYSPVFKAALLWKLGKFKFDAEGFGKLFEDTAALYFTRAKETNELLHVGRLWGDGHADYIVTSKDTKKIIFEFCYGKKDKKQVIKSMENSKSKYGIIVSESDLKLCSESNIIYIPKEFFLLM